MALSGVFITWGFANVGITNQQGQATLLGAATSHEAVTTSVKSATSAPRNANATLQPILSIAAAAAIYFTVGPNADITVSAQPRRYYDPASGPLDIVVNGGDFFSWVAA